jgi:DivIVA domain-containing protein
MPSESLRKVEFDLVHGGYEIGAVDDAIARLEDAFAKNELQRQVAKKGKYALDDRHSRIKEIVIGRTERPKNNKFSRVSWIMRGYDRRQVDQLAEHIERHLVSGAALSIPDVRGAIFKATRGGYAEGQVDAFLDRVIELLQIEQVR